MKVCHIRKRMVEMRFAPLRIYFHSLKGGKKVGDDVRRDAVAVSGRDVAQAEHQERQQEKQAAKLNLSQIVPKVSLDMLKAPSHVLGGPSACRDRFCEFTIKTCFMSQLAARAAYCQSKAL